MFLTSRILCTKLSTDSSLRCFNLTRSVIFFSWTLEKKYLWNCFSKSAQVITELGGNDINQVKADLDNEDENKRTLSSSLLAVSVLSPRGVTPTSKLVCVLPFPDGDARRHKDLPWFGQEKALRPAGEGSLYYLAPKYLYRCGYKRCMEYGSSTAHGRCVACLSIPGSFLL